MAAVSIDPDAANASVSGPRPAGVLPEGEAPPPKPRPHRHRLVFNVSILGLLLTCWLHERSSGTRLIPGSLCCIQVQQLQGVYSLQDPHFWTLCTDVYIGTVKLLVAPDADRRWVLSQTHNVFTQVPERTAGT